MARYTPVPLAYSTFKPDGVPNSKPPVIFVHGVTASKEYWGTIPQVVANTTGRTVYAIDCRNHGDSVRSDIFNFDCTVDDLLHFMDTLDIPKALLIGHSMGGITGIKTALRVPDRVEKLVVEDMHVQKLPQELHDMSSIFFNLARAALQLLPEGMDEETAKNTLIKFIVAKLPEEMKKFLNPDSLEQNMPMQLKRTEDGRYAYKADLDIIEKALKSGPELMSDYVGLYEGPAIFLYGKLSPFKVGLDEPNIKKFLPNAELVGFEKATHSVHFDCPEEFIEAVLKFILTE